MQAPEEVFSGPDVVSVRVATTLGGQDERIPPVSQIAADHLFAIAVVVGRVQKGDAGIQHGVELRFHLLIVHRTTMSGPIA